MQTAAQNPLEILFKPYLIGIERAISKKLEGLNPENQLHAAFRYSLTNGGKRFRPSLVLMMAEAVGKGMDALKASLAIEYFHTATLIADDLPCMDDDDFRRSCLTVHKAYDEATALLASYALIAEGFCLIAENGELLQSKLGFDGAKAGLLALKIASTNTGLQGATGGQYLDLSPPSLNEETISQIHHMKTTSLFEIAFSFGWLFGGGNPKELDFVNNLSASFGMAFQIADDFDDLESDMKEGRSNIVLFLGKEKAYAKFLEEIASFKNALLHLKIEKSALNDIVNYLLTSVNSLIDLKNG